MARKTSSTPRTPTARDVGRAIARVPRQAAVAARRAAVSDAATAMRAGDGFQNFAAMVGAGTDKRLGNTYGITIPIDRFQLEAMFRGSWLAKRIVKTPADDMTRAWINYTWDGYDPDDSSAKMLEVAEKRYSVRWKFNQGLTWGRLYGGAGLLMVLKNETDLSKPLDPEKVKKGDLQLLYPLDRWRLAATGELDYDMSSPNYGLPKYYSLGDPGVNQQNTSRVHWSRVIRFGGEPVPWWSMSQLSWWEDSVLQHVRETIQDYDATMAGVASMVFESNVDIITSPKLADEIGEKAGLQKVIQRYTAMLAMKSINRVLLLDGGEGYKDSVGETYTQKTTQFAGLRDVIEKFMLNVSGAADIPMTRLFGQSPAGLTATGESDIRNYYDRISSDQETKLRSPLERLYEVLVRSTLGFMPENFKIAFNPLWQMSDKEQAEIEKLRAERDQIYVTIGALTEEMVTRELLDCETYRTLEQTDVDMVAKLAKEAPTLAPLVPGMPPRPGAPTPRKPGEPAPPPGPPAIGNKPNGAGALDTSVTDVIKKEAGGWSVYSEGGAKRLGGPYKTKREAIKRLAAVEYFKNEG